MSTVKMCRFAGCEYPSAPRKTFCFDHMVQSISNCKCGYKIEYPILGVCKSCCRNMPKLGKCQNFEACHEYYNVYTQKHGLCLACLENKWRAEVKPTLITRIGGAY